MNTTHTIPLSKGDTVTITHNTESLEININPVAQKCNPYTIDNEPKLGKRVYVATSRGKALQVTYLESLQEHLKDGLLFADIEFAEKKAEKMKQDYESSKPYSIHNKPKIGSSYYYVSAHGVRQITCFQNDNFDRFHLAYGLVFRTEEEAEKKLLEVVARMNS